MDPAMLEPGTLLADRYRVRRHIGSGAFGFVVLVEDLIVHEEIILKFLKPLVASDESVIKRFIQELRFARKITHENVIRIYDFITFGRSYAISMEYFPSRSLSAELKRSSPMQTPRAYHVLRAICRGMDVAHRAGVIHRDLKPENVLLDDADLVKIVDFGVAAARIHDASRLTSAGVIVGTPTYMAPEQAQGGEADPRTDIYSLGVIMYEVATGRPPYVGPDPVAVLLQHVQGNATPPRQVRPTMSHALEAMILKAMAVTPADRYQSMEELGTALDALMASEGA
jgi:serine/threonine-protein kinase